MDSMQTIFKALCHVRANGYIDGDEFDHAERLVLSWAKAAEERDTLLRRHSERIEAVRRRIDCGGLTAEEKRLLAYLDIPYEYDRRTASSGARLAGQKGDAQ